MDPFVSGTTVRLAKPRHLDIDDIRIPSVAGHVVVGGAGIEVFVGPLVTIKYLAGTWRTLTSGGVVTVISQERSYNIPRGGDYTLHLHGRSIWGRARPHDRAL